MQDYLKNYWYYLKEIIHKEWKGLDQNDASELIQATTSDC